MVREVLRDGYPCEHPGQYRELPIREFLAPPGGKRIILARELSLEEIRNQDKYFAGP